MTPKHYQLYPEPLKVIQGWGLPFELGNAIKYIARAGKKSGATELEDLVKATDYLVRYIANAWRIEETPYCIEFYPEPAIGCLGDWPESENIFMPLHPFVFGEDSEIYNEYREEIRRFIEYEKTQWANKGFENMNFDGKPVASVYRAYREWAEYYHGSGLMPLPQRTFIELFREEANLGLVFSARKEKLEDDCH